MYEPLENLVATTALTAPLDGIVAPLEGVTTPRHALWWINRSFRACRTPTLVLANGLFLGLKMAEVPRPIVDLLARSPLPAFTLANALEAAVVALGVWEAILYARRIVALIRSGRIHLHKRHASKAFAGLSVAVAAVGLAIWAFI